MSIPEGIIYPPPDLRGIADSTAKYVAKNGGAFEERIKREHRQNPKFSFLLPDDPFNAYYQYKVKEIRNSLLGGLDSKLSQESQTSQQPSADQPSNDVTSREVQPPSPPSPQRFVQSGNDDEEGRNLNDNDNLVQSSSENKPEEDVHENGEAPKIRPKLDEYIQEMTMKLEEPPPLNFLATVKQNSNDLDSAPMDCDIIKLTAQLIATHGRSFLLELVSREQNNSQFDFLKPQHSQFSYMTNLIMQYALIRNQPLDILEQLNEDATNQKHVLDKFRMRAEWNKMLEVEEKKREEAEEREKLLYSQIDWHDFVIVQTIDYQPDERGEYPPTTADQVGTRLLQQQRFEEQNMPEEMEIDMDVDSNDGESD